MNIPYALSIARTYTQAEVFRVASKTNSCGNRECSDKKGILFLIELSQNIITQILAKRKEYRGIPL